jgi:hypothetical protein
MQTIGQSDWAFFSFSQMGSGADPPGGPGAGPGGESEAHGGFT